jgi:hypothetical protein
MGYSARFSEVDTNQQRFDRTEAGQNDFNNSSRFREEAYSSGGQDIFRQQSAAQYRSNASFLPVMEIVDGGSAGATGGSPMSSRDFGAQGGQSEASSANGSNLAMVDRTMRDASTLLSQVEKARGQGSDAGASPAANTPASAADQPAQPAAAASAADQPAQPAAPASAADQSAQPASPAAGSGDQSTGSKVLQGIDKLLNVWTSTDDTSTT